MPDLLAFGKKAQVCGVMAGPRLDEVKDNVFRLPSRINSTWGGNFTDFVRSTHFLRIIEEEKLVENARVKGDVFHGRIAGDGAASIRIITAVRGRGLMLAFDLPTGAMRDAFWKGAYELACWSCAAASAPSACAPCWTSKTKSIEAALQIMDRRMPASLRRKLAMLWTTWQMKTSNSGAALFKRLGLQENQSRRVLRRMARRRQNSAQHFAH